MPKPLVAIVGRPNVGKSTLFNRIVGAPLAIVEAVPGTTRDRLYADGSWGGRAFTLVDTGGLDPTTTDDIARRVKAQAELAIAEADVIVFLVDGKEGLTATDRDITEVLRRAEKPILLAVNKAESETRRLDSVEFYELGLGDPWPISALQGSNVADLLDEVVAHFPAGEVEETPALVRLAIVGRPNVGKSSLLNAMLGEERAIVHEAPGTTRDAIDTVIEEARGRIVLIDTAGIRRRGRIERGIEKYSVLRALRAIDRADVVLLVMDGLDGVAAQDTHIAGYVREAYKGLVAVVNKWDLVRERARSEKLRGDTLTQEYMAVMREALNFMDYVPVLFISARTGQRVPQVLETALAVQAERGRRIATSELNQVIQDALARHAPPAERGRALKVYYTTQATTDPPTFVFFVNNPQLLHFSYERYLENQLRAAFGFTGTPIKLVFRPREKNRTQINADGRRKK
jgi:GTP-binding protein